jgi:hypothetical protein
MHKVCELSFLKGDGAAAEQQQRPREQESENSSVEETSTYICILNNSLKTIKFHGTI